MSSGNWSTNQEAGAEAQVCSLETYGRDFQAEDHESLQNKRRDG